MSHIAICVEGIGKRYRIGHRSATAGGRAGWLGRLTGPFQYLSSTLREPDQDESFWALKDVSFEVKAGEVVGIIGRNGAGKSTLLKILSRITDPTVGWAEINGRVGSLLEVGTGFHPELTGRENIYMNGAILGMRKAEIDRRFDEIVAFAEIEKFLDTPVKRYSSGMYVRLAFAVAAHLEPEILLVDEVLAVGDAAFQKKCLGKMGDVAKEGRTVLLVSHNVGAISSLCKRAILFRHGCMVADSDAGEAISQYLDDYQARTGTREWSGTTMPGNDDIRLRSVRILSEEKQPIEVINSSTAFLIEVTCQLLKPFPPKVIGVSVFSNQGHELFSSHNDDFCADGISAWDVGTYALYCRLPPFLLNEGRYHLRIASTRGIETCFVEDHVLDFTITAARASSDHQRRGGFFRPLLEWSSSRVG